MGDTVTILFRGRGIQPEILESVTNVTIRRNIVEIVGRGYRKIYFQDTIHSLNSDYNVKVFIK